MQLTIDGSGYFSTGQQQFEQCPGDFFVTEVPSRSIYKGDGWKFIYFEFSPLLRQWMTQSNYIVKNSDERFQIKVVEALKIFMTKDLTVYDNAKEACELFLFILEQINQHLYERVPVVFEVKSYLENHFAEDISLDDLEKQFQLSKYTIIRLFEEHFNYTPMAFLKKYRVNKAIEQLHEDNTIAEIAEKVGFSTSNYFTKVFKKELGITPSDYRRQINFKIRRY